MPPAPSFCAVTAVDASIVSDRVILYHRDSHRTVVLNPAGTVLWQQLAQPCTLEQLAAYLQSRFSALSGEQALRDAQNFVDELLLHELIRISN